MVLLLLNKLKKKMMVLTQQRINGWKIRIKTKTKTKTTNQNWQKFAIEKKYGLGNKCYCQRDIN